MFDELRQANARYAETFTLRGLPPSASRGLGLVTCVDTRIEPLAALGLRPGDAKIMRNAGGRVTSDVLRSLTLVVALLGVNEIVVMHHSACALAGKTDTELLEMVNSGNPVPLGPQEFLAMPDPDAALVADVEAIRTCASLPSGVPVAGWRYDVETGLVAEIIAASNGVG